MDDSAKRFGHYHCGPRIKSSIAVEHILESDIELFLLVSLIGSESIDGYTNEDKHMKYIGDCLGKLFENAYHDHQHPKMCVRCSVERTYCKALAIIGAANALCGDITLLELSAIVLSSEYIFMERKSLLTKTSITKLPIIPISQIGTRLKYWDLLKMDTRETYRCGISKILQRLQSSSSVIYSIDL
jgi:hypothetical protein